MPLRGVPLRMQKSPDAVEQQPGRDHGNNHDNERKLLATRIWLDRHGNYEKKQQPEVATWF